MILLQNALILIACFAAMEGVAYLAHKYVMHGLLWSLHRDHHKKDHGGFFEYNDAFFLIFATPGIALIYFGFNAGPEDFRLWAGVGISLYGLAYLAMHDLFIHQRFSIFKRTDNTYLRAARKAHRMHHRHLGKEDGECFGMLWVAPKYLKDAKHTSAQQENDP